MAIRQLPHIQKQDDKPVNNSTVNVLGFVALGFALAYLFSGSKNPSKKKGMNNPEDLGLEIIEKTDDYTIAKPIEVEL